MTVCACPALPSQRSSDHPPAAAPSSGGRWQILEKFGSRGITRVQQLGRVPWASGLLIFFASPDAVGSAVVRHRRGRAQHLQVAPRASHLAPRTPAWPDSGCACLRLTGPARAGAERDLPRPRFFVAPPFASRAVTASVARGRRQPAQRAARGNLRHATRSSRSKRGRLQWVSISTPLDPPNQ